MSDVEVARARLRRMFQPYLEANVSAGVLNLSEMHAEKQLPNLNQWLDMHFTPDWPGLRPNYGGTMGHHTAFMQAKINWLAHCLETGELESASAHTCLERLQAFWKQWAGVRITASDEVSRLNTTE